MDVLLREISHSDIEKIRNWRNSENVSKYMYTSNIISKEDQEKWFNNQKNDETSLHWIIEYDAKGLGLASLTNIDKIFNSCYWAFYLGDTSLRGVGIGAKVEYNVLKYVFETLNLNKLRCEVISFNDRVIKMHEKFGFRREAFYREHVEKKGLKHDVVGLAMLKYEWEFLKTNIYERVYRKNK
jgi:hypothetical protein